MTRLKICGLREPAHAVAAADAGADFLGFVFVPGVRRRLTVVEARDAIAEFRRRRASGTPRLVGLFADQPLEEVASVARACGLDLVQLCGGEPPDYWRRLGWPVFKQVRVREAPTRGQTVEDVLRAVECVVRGGHTALLDAYDPASRGGTGLAFDWTIAAEVARRFDVLLAGGLTPENVGAAIAVAQPWGVDVSSGVETDGVKDPRKIETFAEAVRRAGDPA